MQSGIPGPCSTVVVAGICREKGGFRIGESEKMFVKTRGELAIINNREEGRFLCKPAYVRERKRVESSLLKIGPGLHPVQETPFACDGTKSGHSALIKLSAFETGNYLRV